MKVYLNDISFCRVLLENLVLMENLVSRVNEAHQDHAVQRDITYVLVLVVMLCFLLLFYVFLMVEILE